MTVGGVGEDDGGAGNAARRHWREMRCDAADAVDAVFDCLKPLLDVGGDVLLPMIAAAESFLAESALVRSFAGMKTHVDFQLKTEAKSFAALRDKIAGS